MCKIKCVGCAFFQNHYKCCRPPINGAAGYAYVDTMVALNVRKACAKDVNLSATACEETIALLEQRRAQYPLSRWNDLTTGRHLDWPASTREAARLGH